MLPKWIDTERKVYNGEPLTPLELFIYNNEPAGDDDAEKFLRELEAAINDANENTPLKQFVDKFNSL